MTTTADRAASPGSTEGLRRRNTSIVLRSLRQLGPATRAELAKRTGLAKATVGVIVAGLEAAGAVTEIERSGSVAAVRGRPGTPVSLSGHRFLGIGLELNVDYVAVAVLDLSGQTRLSATRPVAAPGDVTALLELAAWARGQVSGNGEILVGGTVAVPGLVRGDNRTIDWAPNIGLSGAGLAEDVEAVLGCPVAVLNDANCAAYAEAHHGAATDTDHALYLTGTVGIGAGIVDRGDLIRGAVGFAGEVGHMPIGDSTALCGCGRRGCWEASIGLYAVLAKVGLPELSTPLATAAAVAAAAASDPRVTAALEEVGRDVGLGVAMLTSVLDPAVVVLGGYFVPLGELVLAPARAALDARLASAAQHRPELRLSTLGIEAAAMGAAEQSFADVFSGDLELV
ncbi:Sugar kinase of the NBD/HSP70 family, may contain an N-terminal HTH domain [Nocardioides terrae]|uniref:Sugar kinase of the NBD/HSP70 family, may contain an N-terminal HTH domain n=1 Tax=Nocardioides terrae TaxID=574651 RepID=A0A1I1LTC2_9ACTN|nr:ROK family transcriptional regulator [Nocardioides terrae]SFC72710.1 Sugar kinase of the NBD/HSP70 family, may contain an N-terminal HTH domain [Nocardioides terrae]